MSCRLAHLKNSVTRHSVFYHHHHYYSCNCRPARPRLLCRYCFFQASPPWLNVSVSDSSLHTREFPM